MSCCSAVVHSIATRAVAFAGRLMSPEENKVHIALLDGQAYTHFNKQPETRSLRIHSFPWFPCSPCFVCPYV